jgi:uncharacterized protein YjbJ (UPF0337 family)
MSKSLVFSGRNVSFVPGLALEAPGVPHPKEGTMDKDRMKGSATNMGGKAKEAAGNLTGDSKLKGEGKMDQGNGKVQNAIGGIKDAIKGK